MPGGYGLNKNDKPHRLLTQIDNRPRSAKRKSPEDIDDSLTSTSEDRAPPKFRKLDDSDDISGSETPKARPRSKKSKESSSSDSTPGRNERGSISRTKFETKSAPTARRREPPSDSENAKITKKTTGSSNAKKKGPGRKEETPAHISSSDPRSVSSKTPSSSAGHLESEHGFTRSRQFDKKFGGGGKPPLKVYGKRATNRSASSSFREASASEEQTPKNSSKFKPVPDSPGSTTTEQSPAKLRGTDDDDVSSSFPGSQSSGRNKKGRKGKGKRLSSVRETPDSPPPVFNAFLEDEPIPEFTLSKSQARELQYPSDVDSLDDEILGLGSTEKTMAPTLCPWCEDVVDAELLKEFSKGQRLNVRQQKRFCHKHKRQTALDAWEAKSYPSIDWLELPNRINNHRQYLLRIINGGTSHYRKQVADKIETGEDRALKREGNLNPGYYGPRGFNLMCDQLVSEFSELLKEKAISDRVISGRGSASFIQTVLVAELAVKLIMEDMDVPMEEARGIMEESKAIGEMVHDEP